MASRSAEQWAQAPRVPESHYVSGDVYRDREIFQQERTRIFDQSWVVACHESELQNDGDFRTIDYLGIPLILVKSEDKRIRTFFNVCSHRGAKIVHESAGNARHFTCFYHLWSYDLYGSCVDIPRADAYKSSGLKKKDSGLREVRTEVFLGLVFINVDGRAPKLGSFLDGSLDRMSEVMGQGNLEVFHYNRAVINSNWKAFIETNRDAYHTLMHVALRRTQVDNTRKVTEYRNGHVGGGGQKMSYANYKGWGQRDESLALPGVASTDFRTVHLFPNAMVLSRGTVIRIDTIIPIDEHHTALEFRGLGMVGDDEKKRAARIRHHNDFWGPFGRNVPEDAFAAEACEKTFGVGAARYQVIAREEGLAGQDDAGLRKFYETWSQQIGWKPHLHTNRN